MVFFSPSSYVTATGFITLESRSVRRKEKEEAKEGKRKVKFQLFFRQPRVAVPCTAECRGEEKERREREGRREREEGEGERKEKEKHRGGRFDSTRVETIRVRIGHALMNRVAPPTRGGGRRGEASER